MTTHEVEVHFASGRDLLSAYWGHLTGGGLAIRAKQASKPLHEGRTVNLLVHVGDALRVEIRGTVVRASSRKAVVAFSRSDAKEQLLTAAFSARQIETMARVRTDDPDQPSEFEVTVHRLSESGCCLSVDPQAESPLLFLGTEVTMDIADLSVTGCVVASIGAERWVMFDPDDSPSDKLPDTDSGQLAFAR